MLSNGALWDCEYVLVTQTACVVKGHNVFTSTVAIGRVSLVKAAVSLRSISALASNISGTCMHTARALHYHDSTRDALFGCE